MDRRNETIVLCNNERKRMNAKMEVCSKLNNETYCRAPIVLNKDECKTANKIPIISKIYQKIHMAISVSFTIIFLSTTMLALLSS